MSANSATSGLNPVVLAPTSFAKASAAASTGSLAMICFGVTRPARTKPLASAVAILPAPRKPIDNLDAMGRSCSRLAELAEAKRGWHPGGGASDTAPDREPSRLAAAESLAETQISSTIALHSDPLRAGTARGPFLRAGAPLC